MEARGIQMVTIFALLSIVYIWHPHKLTKTFHRSVARLSWILSCYDLHFKQTNIYTPPKKSKNYIRAHLPHTFHRNQYWQCFIEKKVIRLNRGIWKLRSIWLHLDYQALILWYLQLPLGQHMCLFLRLWILNNTLVGGQIRLNLKQILISNWNTNRIFTSICQF